MNNNGLNNYVVGNSAGSNGNSALMSAYLRQTNNTKNKYIFWWMIIISIMNINYNWLFYYLNYILFTQIGLFAIAFVKNDAARRD